MTRKGVLWRKPSEWADQVHLMDHLMHNRTFDNSVHSYFVEGSHFLLCPQFKDFGYSADNCISFNSSVWSIIMFLSCSQSLCERTLTFSHGPFSGFAVFFLWNGRRTTYSIPDVRSHFVSFTMPFLMTPEFCCSLGLKKESGPECLKDKMIVSLFFLS